MLRAGTALVAALPLAGCGLLDPGPAAGDAGTGTLVALWHREQELVARYAAAVTRFPSLAGRLRPVRADHAAHAEALGALVAARATASPVPSPPVATVGPAATTTAVLAELAGAEAAASTAAGRAALTAEGDTAALLASIAACESTHLVVLR